MIITLSGSLHSRFDIVLRNLGLNSVFSLFALYLDKFEGNVKLASEKLFDKLDFNWNNKIILDSAKKRGFKKYSEAKSILKSNLDLYTEVEIEN